MKLPDFFKTFLTPVMFLGAIFCGMIQSSALAQSNKNEVVNQSEINEFACGPCAILNALNFSSGKFKVDGLKLKGDSDTAKVQTIIDQFGSKDSLAHEGSKRFNDKFTGTAAADMIAIYNDVLKESGSDLEVAGLFLNRRQEELPVGNLRRSHGMMKASIDAGLPVVLSVRGFAASYSEERDKYVWNALSTHYVTVDSVQESLGENEKGFSFQFLDSNTGKREYGYINIDEARNFTAAKGNAEKWEWLRDRAFPVVTAPSLRLKTSDQKFFVRTFITANHIIVPKSVVEDFASQVFDTVVEASCGTCQFEMEGEGCPLAIRIGENSYFVEGTDIDSHGDAHAKDGFCNCIRKAVVSGSIKEGKFTVDQMSLLPQEKVSAKKNDE